MKQHKKLPLLAGGFILVTLLVWFWIFFVRTSYTVDETVSNFKLTPLNGVELSLEGSRRSGSLEVTYDGEGYIVIDLSRSPLRIEQLQEDGWHRIQSDQLFWGASETVSKTQSYHDEFRWKELLGGPLDPGTYRAILFYGNGAAEIYTFSTAAEFTVS